MKALSLFSGGLDSTLAMKIIKDQGIEVVAVNINTGFGSSKDKSEHMRYMCEQIGVELKIIDIQEEFLQDVLFSPKYGYGKNFNPCIDCHAKMFSVAKRVMENEGASFLISGEVLGQRPMSQNRDALQTVLNESDCDGLLVRPLSAKNLAPTIAEINGWIDREKLEAINGRNRERQMQLVVEYGLQDIETPGGGCLLTEEHFSKKIRDFVQYDDLHVKDIPVIKHGRHLRLPDGAKLVIGRDKDDNQYIINIENEKFIHIKTDGIVGPHSLLSADASQADRDLSAKIILTFCKTKVDMSYGLLYENESVKASPFSSRAEANKFLL
ncbi:MAG: 7-cyano-7-deazaguanine synthase [Campylobacterota bacterium]|nr:7-cyano-7-deazaguanine synthase [Campylobacterota bacterium]